MPNQAPIDRWTAIEIVVLRPAVSYQCVGGCDACKIARLLARWCVPVCEISYLGKIDTIVVMFLCRVDAGLNEHKTTIKGRNVQWPKAHTVIKVLRRRKCLHASY